MFFANPGRPSISSYWTFAAGVVAIVFSGLIFSKVGVHSNDFAQYYVGARSLATTGDPYAKSGADFELTGDPQCCYPPFVAYAVRPIAAFSVSQASYIWFGISLGLTFWLAAQLVRLVFHDVEPRIVVVAVALLLLYPPQAIGLVIGQVHTVIGALLVGAFQAARSGREYRAGCLLAAASLWKVFPIVLLVVFLLAGRRRTVLTATAIITAFVAATWSEHCTYVERFVIGGYYPVAAQCFVSIPALARRLFAVSDYARPPLESTMLRYATSALGVGAILALCLRFTVHHRSLEALFPPALVAMLLVTPPAGYYHMNLALIAVAIWCGRRWSKERRATISPRWSVERTPDRPVAGAMICLAVTAIPVEYGLTGATTGWGAAALRWIHIDWGVLLLVPQTYGLIGLLVLLTHVDRCSTPELPSPHGKRPPA